MLTVVKWYMSGWHVKPKGVKKPYNPVLGEIFRANYPMDDGSIVSFFAEQVNCVLHVNIEQLGFSSSSNFCVVWRE
jgi:hypothetical protein